MRVRTSGLALLLVLAACGDDGMVTPPTAGAGAGGLPTTAGMGAGVGASGAGAGAAGAGAGAGAAGAGAGGMAGGSAGMGGAMAGMGGSGGSAAMPGAPKWTAIWEEIIQATGCNGGISCHQGNAAGFLAMPTKEMAYLNLVGKAAMGVNIPPSMTPPNCKDSGMMRVVPGQPDMSLLVKKVEMTMPPCGNAMPPGNPPMLLPAAQQQQIRQWIMLGAMND